LQGELLTIDALIVSFNTKDLLHQTLETLVQHGPKPPLQLRVRVLDNGSSDGSADMVAATFPEIDLLRSERNLGFGDANNALVRRSAADYVLLLNSDVIVSRDVVTPLVSALESDPRILAAGPRLVSPDGRVQYSAQKLPSLSYEIASVIRGKRLGRVLTPVFDSNKKLHTVHEVDLTNARISRFAEFIWATCWLFRRADLPQGRLFDPRFPMYDEDLDFCHRVQEQGRRMWYEAGAEIVHIGGASTASAAHKRRLTSRARRRYYAHHYGLGAASVYAAFLPVVSAATALIDRVPKPRRRASDRT
jgi:N-acetylglucosaminyl-diphospho-decaprenol L-rhamnosyltransferase